MFHVTVEESCSTRFNSDTLDLFTFMSQLLNQNQVQTFAFSHTWTSWWF